jgi:hypothetical protein
MTACAAAATAATIVITDTTLGLSATLTSNDIGFALLPGLSPYTTGDVRDALKAKMMVSTIVAAARREKPSIHARSHCADGSTSSTFTAVLLVQLAGWFCTTAHGCSAV